MSGCDRRSGIPCGDQVSVVCLHRFGELRPTGFDEILEVHPSIAAIVGDGDHLSHSQSTESTRLDILGKPIPYLSYPGSRL